MSNLILANTGKSTDNRFILWFGAVGTSHIMVWADCLDEALDIAIDDIAERWPGYFSDDQVRDDYLRYLAEGMDEEKAMEQAEMDMTCAGNNGHYLPSWEWGIDSENPTRERILQLQGRI